MKFETLTGINYPKPGVVVTPGKRVAEAEEVRAEAGEVVDLSHLSEGARAFLLSNNAIRPVSDDEPETDH